MNRPKPIVRPPVDLNEGQHSKFPWFIILYLALFFFMIVAALSKDCVK